MLPNALLRYIRYTHAQTCDCVPVQSATQGAASLHTLHKPISCDNVPVQSAQQCTASVHTQYFTHAQACDNVRVQSATQCTVSVNIILDTCPNLLFVCFFGANFLCICRAKDFCIHHTAVASQGNPETQWVYHVRSNALGQRCLACWTCGAEMSRIVIVRLPQDWLKDLLDAPNLRTPGLAPFTLAFCSPCLLQVALHQLLSKVSTFLSGLGLLWCHFRGRDVSDLTCGAEMSRMSHLRGRDVSHVALAGQKCFAFFSPHSTDDDMSCLLHFQGPYFLHLPC